MWQSRNDGPCPLASSPLFEHPVNHIVRSGDFLSLPRRSHLPPPPPPPFRPLACRSPAAAPRRLLRHRRHPIRRIRPYAYAKSFPPSLPPSLLHWPLAVELLSADGRMYAYKCVFAASPRKRPSRGGAAGCSVRRPPSPPRAAHLPPSSVSDATFVLAARVACDLPPPRPPPLPHRIFPTKTAGAAPPVVRTRSRQRPFARSASWPLPYIFNLNATDDDDDDAAAPATPCSPPLRVAAWRRQYLNARRKCHTTLGTPPHHRRRKEEREGGRQRRAQAQAVYCRLPTDAPLTTNSTPRSNSADVGGGGEGGEDGGAAAYEFPNKRLLKPVRRRSSLFPAVVAPASM